MSAGPLEIVDMQSRPAEGEPCPVCGRPCDGYHALPIFNGDVVSNDWPGEWFGRECCQQCYEDHAAGRMKTSDHLYGVYLDRLGMFVDGGGI